MAGNQACSCSPRSCRNILWTAISYLPISSGQRREIREAAQNIVQNAEYRMQKSEAGSHESYGLGTVKRRIPNGTGPISVATSGWPLLGDPLRRPRETGLDFAAPRLAGGSPYRRYA